MSDVIIWSLLIFVVIIIIGLYLSESTPLNVNEKEKILKLNYITEHFSPSHSTTSQQESGASALYNWGMPEEKEKKTKKDECKHKCTPSCPEKCELKCIEKKETSREICAKCDITLNHDISKYILKSSVPACPDMNNYVTKNMIPPNVDMNNYILKSEIKPCVETDISKYILKTEIPACPTCPICPECPICPVCPPQIKCKEINEFNIIDHPDLNKYMKIEDVERDYIHKDKVAESDVCKNSVKNNATPLLPTPPLPPSPPSQQISNDVNNQINSSIDNMSKKIREDIESSYKKDIKRLSIKQEEMDAKLIDPDGYYAGDSLYARF
jgi:hypothetical protein